jgi:hypothetical protein
MDGTQPHQAPAAEHFRALLTVSKARQVYHTWCHSFDSPPHKSMHLDELPRKNQNRIQTKLEVILLQAEAALIPIDHNGINTTSQTPKELKGRPL